MDITYLGHASFKLKGKTASVVTDPYPAAIGFKMPVVRAEVVTVSHRQHDDHKAVDQVLGTKARKQPVVIDAPGEYEVQGVSIFGTSSFHDEVLGKERGKNTIFTIHIDDLTVTHLGDLGQVLDKKQVEEINGVDILLVPVGGVYTLDPARAAKVIDQVEPAIVIPMHYKVKGLAETFAKLASVDEFLKEVGAEAASRESRLSLTKASLHEEREVVVLERQR